MILLVDNYDSFAHNLQRYLVRLGQEVMVVRNDDPRLAEAFEGQSTHPAFPPFEHAADFKAIVLSPGPKRPIDAGFCLALVRRFSGAVPILGVCLGHQIICEAFGANIIRAIKPIHGLATPIVLERSGLFAGLLPTIPESDSSPAKVTVDFARYHSLVADAEALPECLQVTAWSLDGQIMAVQHKQHRTYGIQFHPESILTTQGYRLLGNFLSLAGCRVEPSLPAGDLQDEAWLADWHTARLDESKDISAPAVAHPTAAGLKKYR